MSNSQYRKHRSLSVASMHANLVWPSRTDGNTNGSKLDRILCMANFS